MTTGEEERAPHIRSNGEMEKAVNRGLAAACLHGVFAGADEMFKNNVPIEVVSRVLLKPELRRSSDWSSNFLGF